MRRLAPNWDVYVRSYVQNVRTHAFLRAYVHSFVRTGVQPRYMVRPYIPPYIRPHKPTFVHTKNTIFSDFQISGLLAFWIFRLYWTLLPPTAPYWTLLDPAGPYWALLDPTGPSPSRRTLDNAVRIAKGGSKWGWSGAGREPPPAFAILN